MAERKQVRDQVVHLDYGTLRDTDYYNCTLVYEGGSPPTMANCNFVNCEFIFDKAAQNTQYFLRMLAQSGAAEFVVRDYLGLVNWGPRDA